MEREDTICKRKRKQNGFEREDVLPAKLTEIDREMREAGLLRNSDFDPRRKLL